MPLNDAAVRAAKPNGRTQRLWDSGGLYLEVSPSGGRWWRFKYRFGEGEGRREKRVSLGTYPDVSLKQARAARDRCRAQLADGIDPSAAKQAGTIGRDAPTFKQIADEWVSVRKPGWSPSYAVTVEARLRNDVHPYIGKLTMPQVKAAVVLEVLRRIESRGAIETARRVRTIIGLVCKYAVATDRAEHVPTAALTPDVLAPAPKVKHHAAPLDPKQIGEILRILDGYKGTPTVRVALLLSPLFGVRPGELRHARWDDIDLDAAQWSFQASKNGPPHIVPLARQAVALFRELKPLTGSNPAGLVFPGRDQQKPFSNNTVNAALKRLDITGDELVAHGWRACLRTLAVEILGYRAEVVEMQLAHAVKDPNGRAYNRTTWLAERTRMMQEWADWLDKQRSTKRS